MYDSVFRGKEIAYKSWSCIISMFLMSFNIYFCLAMHVSLCVWPVCLKTVIWFILALFETRSAFFGEPGHVSQTHNGSGRLLVLILLLGQHLLKSTCDYASKLHCVR